MFKSVDTSRSWPTTGMTSEKWLSVRTFSVKIDSLVATQDGVFIHPLIDPPAPVGGDEFPHVVFWNNILYLEDGHHRVVRAKIGGQDRVVARVLIIK
jgi:hypothetical protein